MKQIKGKHKTVEINATWDEGLLIIVQQLTGDAYQPL